MTSYIEFEGKNIEQAVKKACGKLKIDKENIKYKVISYGSTGIFGLAGRKKAKIEVSISAEKKPKVEQAEKKKDGIDDHGIKENEIRKTNIKTGMDVLQKIVDSITDDAKIEIQQRKNKTVFNVVGGNSALLIGKRGRTLEAIQLIVDKAINKKNEKRSRTRVDVEGYVEKRNSYLKSLAKRLADKCKRFGKPVSVGEMNAHDRRIIHITLKSDKEVGTKSKGEGILRKIVIFPKKSSYQKKEMVQAKIEKAN
ncbi:MAG: RNA-binding cell elongation regulator Jag/EloR [Thermodesulfobacteriota bacterium]|nr:RNA-binding cell elongation regulator Jag/EloR [Thermodesulfobacteriota bacterium]